MTRKQLAPPRGARLRCAWLASVLALVAPQGVADAAPEVLETRAYLFQFCPVAELQGLEGWTPDDALHRGVGQTGSAVHEGASAGVTTDGTLVPRVLPDLDALRDLRAHLRQSGALHRHWQTSGQLFHTAEDTPCLVLIEGRFGVEPPRVDARALRGRPPEGQIDAWNWTPAWRALFQLDAAPHRYAEIALSVDLRVRALRLQPRFVDFNAPDAPIPSDPVHRLLVVQLSLRGIDLPVGVLMLPAQDTTRQMLGPGGLTGAIGHWIPLPRLVDAQGAPDRRLPNGALNVVATLVESVEPLGEALALRPPNRLVGTQAPGAAQPPTGQAAAPFD